MQIRWTMEESQGRNVDNVCHSAPFLSALGMKSDEETGIGFNSREAGTNSRCRIGEILCL